MIFTESGILVFITNINTNINYTVLWINVFYLIDSFHGVKRLWIVLKDKSSDLSLMLEYLKVFLPMFFDLNEQKKVK